ncbi:hypothetical protein [Bosea sp. (in: a-proteobacteria)]|uniref:hypothetical protein n=1 Tax=Bosea sp. (in: a-proteobacteria) TaxID=1871050 RepID=UPI0025BA5B56|nr:hypothetical protein [Bosea sp. (in: a-proteobacteria)]
MDFGNLVGPAVVAAVVSGIISVVSMVVNRSTTVALHKDKLEADQKLAERKIEADITLAKRKFEYDRHQAVFKRRFELAELLLADAYRYRSLMQFIRNGASFGSEGETRTPAPYESDNEKRQRNNYYVPLERIHAQDEFLSGMFARRTVAKALFGPEAEKAFDHFQMALHRVRSASGMLVEWTKDHDGVDKDLMKKLRNDIWEPMAEHNQANDIGQMVDDGVAVLEGLCKPVLAWVDTP